jgi:hypothetical protein
MEGLTEALHYELQEHGIRVKLVEPGGSKTNFGSSSLVQTPHPAYRALVDGFDKMWEKESAKLPGPEKVVQTDLSCSPRRISAPALPCPCVSLSQHTQPYRCDRIERHDEIHDSSYELTALYPLSWI